jgi:hypothetical protein
MSSAGLDFWVDVFFSLAYGYFEHSRNDPIFLFHADFAQIESQIFAEKPATCMK